MWEIHQERAVVGRAEDLAPQVEMAWQRAVLSRAELEEAQSMRVQVNVDAIATEATLGRQVGKIVPAVAAAVGASQTRSKIRLMEQRKEGERPSRSRKCSRE